MRDLDRPPPLVVDCSAPLGVDFLMGPVSPLNDVSKRILMLVLYGGVSASRHNQLTRLS